MHKHRKTILSL